MWHNCKHRNFRAFFFYRSNYCNENCWLKCLRGLSLCHSVCVYWMWNGEQSIVCQFLEKRTHETIEKKKVFICSFFRVALLLFLRVISVLLFLLSLIWLVTKNQPKTHTHNSSPISICQSCSRANGYWAKMRLPFSLTKYMRFSVWFSFSFTRSITVQAISLPLSLSCTCLIFQIFIFILVECSCCPSYSCRCTFLRFVRARHSITCCFVCVLFFSPFLILIRLLLTCDSFFFLPLILRAITFRLNRLLCLIELCTTFIIEFSAHMRGGNASVHRFSKQSSIKSTTTTTKWIHRRIRNCWQNSNIPAVKR